jgi:MFS family permease
MTATTLHQRSSWLPMLVIALVQIQMAFNVSALVISMGAIVDDFQTSPTTIATALVVYSLGVAAFVMLGARIATILGARLVFQVSVIVHGVSMAIMAVATGPVMMLLAQLLAGLAAAAAVPTLVVMIATHYREQQQQQALGLLGAAQAIAGVGAFLIVGFLGTIIGWRLALVRHLPACWLSACWHS